MHQRDGRATLETFRSTPLGVVMAESKPTSAGILLDSRQTSFAYRLMARSRGHHGPEEIIERQESAFGQRLLRVAHDPPGNAVEEQR